ncbi:HAD domain-containing protein [Paenibacillus sp. FJAT-26967]|uniref:HAD domain-containing protein n=1 Tax=Paenibacillus sp. FJAT-26967 TaxID=1729690 RepID=UPI0012E3D801|nr:HAD domain-containing protein [Paenibacillus sp. FJAT-26967]
MDIDGVLNTDRAVRMQKNSNKDTIDFDQESMMNLAMILKETNSYIVLTSTWRIHYGTDSRLWTELIRNFVEFGIEKRLLDITPILDKHLHTENRWKEIEMWLHENQETRSIESFVILDDEWDMGIYTKDRFLKCQGYRGISIELKEKAVELLRTPII